MERDESDAVDRTIIRRRLTVHRDGEDSGSKQSGRDVPPTTTEEDAIVTDDILRGMSIDKMRDRMQRMEREVIDNVARQLRHTVADVMQQLQDQFRPGRQLNDLFNEPTNDKNGRKSSREGKLPEKQFLRRNSLLTDLFEIKHIKTIYHIFIVILIILFINTAVYDIVDTGSTNFGISTIMLGFGKFDRVVYTWLGMMVSTFGAYVAFAIWANYRANGDLKPFTLKVWDHGWLAAFIVFQISFIVIPVRSLLADDLPPASSLVLLMEQVRLVMKSHAFVRSAAPGCLVTDESRGQGTSNCPRFSTFLYFLFAPTLVYRDEYPRTKEIRWRVVVWSYMEVVLVVFYMAFIFERLLIPVFRQFGARPLEPRTLVLSIFGTMMPGTLAFLCGFYCLLHSWMNASAEVLRFADRMFYKDWWNSTSYGAYYRTWNVVVHDWLYTYIYKDMYEIVAPRNRLLSTYMVFSVSAIFHEYILAFAFRFFYPMLLVMFGGFGMLFVYITRKNARAGGNVFMWLTLCMGTGTLLSLYSMEYYARINCPPHEDEFLDLFVPRSWTCHRLSGTVA